MEEKTWTITPHDGTSQYTVLAADYQYDTTTGTHQFKDADSNQVATLLNVSVRLEQKADKA